MKFTSPALFAAMLFLGFSGSGMALDSTADLVYVNGKIYTVDEQQSWAEAVAIKDGAFIAVGTTEDVKALSGDKTEVIDLNGKFAMPGLHDQHVHMEQSYKGDILGDQLLTFPDEETSIEKLQQMLKAHAENNPDQKVLFAQNLQQGLFPNNTPTKAFIDDVIPGRPVVILSDSEHEGLLNTKALEMEGITADTASPEGGEIAKDPKTGEPIGWLKETAAGTWAWKHYPQVSPEDHENGLKATIAYLNSIGITTVKQQHAKNPIAVAAQELEKEGSLNARIGLSWTYKGPLEPMPLEEQEKMISERGRFSSDLIKTEYVKLSGDGNAGTTGYVIDPYQVSNDQGIAFFTDDALFEEVEKFDAMGMGVTIHVTGDAANRQMIDAVDRVKKKHGKLNARHQLGHASLIHPDDYPRLKELDITAEFSPVVWFSTGFVEAQREQLGQKRMDRWYPMKSVIEHGGRIVIASDAPLMWQEPFARLEGAVTRVDPASNEGTPLASTEAIDVAAAIRAMTLDSAYLMNIEDSVGSIEVGKRADMIILDKNIVDIPAKEISSAKVLVTLFDGKVVYDASKDPSDEEAIEKKHGLELDFSGTTGHPGCEWH